MTAKVVILLKLLKLLCRGRLKRRANRSGGILATFANGLWHFESVILGNGGSKGECSAGVRYSTWARDHVLGEMGVLEAHESAVRMAYRTRT